MKTVKMIFPRDMFYNDLANPIYVANKIYDVPENMVDRWLKRGGVLATEVEQPKVEQKEPVEPVEQKAEDQEKPKAKPNKPIGNKRP